MITAATKRLVLPFSNKHYNDTAIESAAVFAVAESERKKGGGLFSRQSEERIVFLSKMGYPLWLFPKNDRAFIFDGLGIANFNLTFLEIPPAKIFIDTLEARSRPRETYASFLIDHSNFFKQNSKEKSMKLEGLLAENGLLKEVNVYRKEAADLTSLNLGLLTTRLDQAAAVTTIYEFDKQKSISKDDTKQLQECLRAISKLTSQYITELNFEAAAATEEIDAKIKAQQEVITPETAKLMKEYNRKIKEATDSFNEELESLRKLKGKTEKVVEQTQKEIKKLQQEAKAHAAKVHRANEKRWKEKIKLAQKESNSLKKELKKIGNDTKKISQQKNQTIANLKYELDQEVKLVRQPLAELQVIREEKERFFKKEAQKLLLAERAVAEDLKLSINTRKTISVNLDDLGIKQTGLQNPTLFFVPFYIVCYETGATRRYFAIPPSSINQIDFSTKFLGAFGKSKIRSLLFAMFREITKVIQSAILHANKLENFESQLYDIGQRSNLLGTNVFQEKVKKGLIELQRGGWLSEREQQYMHNQLVT
jgi:hypothetical protein